MEEKRLLKFLPRVLSQISRRSRSIAAFFGIYATFHGTYITSELTQFRVKIKILRIMSSCFYILSPKAEFLRDLIEWVPLV